jgi:hypothetical protein
MIELIEDNRSLQMFYAEFNSGSESSIYLGSQVEHLREFKIGDMAKYQTFKLTQIEPLLNPFLLPSDDDHLEYSYYGAITDITSERLIIDGRTHPNKFKRAEYSYTWYEFAYFNLGFNLLSAQRNNARLDQKVKEIGLAL